MSEAISWEKFTNKAVALLGAGKENISLIPYLTKAGASVTLCDKTTDPTTITELEKISGVELQLGDDYLSELENFDFIFRSPGLPVQEVDSVLRGKAKQPIRTSAVDLFLQFVGSQTIGVTGTKGKGTTTTMLAEILRAAGRNVIVAGNIGNSIFDSLAEVGDTTTIVLELSSFQLEDIQHAPHIAVILPIVPDHLEPLSARSPNYHHSMTDYVTAKGNITAHQKESDILVFAADNQYSSQLASSSAAQTFAVSHTKGYTTIKESGSLTVDSIGPIELSEAGLSGSHMFLDAALAATAATLLGATETDILKGVANFKPLPHRLQTVGEYNDIQIVDDSYATAPDATIAALSAFKKPIVLLAGGSTKGADFQELAFAVKDKKVVAVLLIGEEAPKIKKALEEVHYEGVSEIHQSLSNAIKRARELSKAGGVVLLSPGCASKDMFRDAADRGEQFSIEATQVFSEN